MSHDPQRRGHWALTRCQDRAHYQKLRSLPGHVGEELCEGKKNGYCGIGQGEHGLAFP